MGRNRSQNNQGQAKSQKIKRKKNPITIKPKDKTFLLTQNLTNDKLDTPYIKTFKIIIVKNTTVELFLPETKKFPKFYAFLIKKAPPDTPLAIIWNYSTKEKYEMEKILQKKQGGQKTKFLVKWKNYDISKAILEPKTHLINAQTAFRQFRKAI